MSDISIRYQTGLPQNLEKRFDYVFEKENKYPGAPSVKAIEVSNNKD